MNMANNIVTYTPIGVIGSPHKTLADMPIQPSGAAGIRGTVEVFEPLREGLKDLEGFSHIILLYHFHRSEGYALQVVPFLDTEQRGLFATRAPRRPNPIGLSIVKLNKIEGRLLHIENVDILDGTPLLDIKPYVPAFDGQTKVRAGWLETARKKAGTLRSDERFSGPGGGGDKNGI